MSLYTKTLAKFCFHKHVHLATYDDTAQFLKSVDVGIVMSNPRGHDQEACDHAMFYLELEDTLRRSMAVSDISDKLKFPTENQQCNLFFYCLVDCGNASWMCIRS